MSSGMCHLRNSVLPLVWIRDAAVESISTALGSVPGPKALVLDKQLSGPLGFVVEVALLKRLGIEAMFELSREALPAQVDNVAYFIRPSLQAVKLVAEQIQEHQSHNETATRRKHYLFIVPRRTLLCERSLANLGVYGDLECNELSLDLYPLDDDVLSLCLNGCWRELAINGDPTCLYYTARAVLRLQHLYGRARRIIGKGQHSMRVANLMQRMESETCVKMMQHEDDREGENSMIDCIVMLDRNVDMVTPMLQQLTYEGVLDENIGISNGYVEVNKSVLGIKGRPGTTKVALNSNDSLFKEIRGVNFSALGPHLKQKAASVQATYEERHNAETISEMGQFMKKFKNLQKLHTSLQTHIALAERLSETTRQSSFHRRVFMEHSLLDGTASDVEGVLEEMIGRRDPLPSVLRLLCLLSLVNNGIKQRAYDHLRREIVQSYGYQHIFTLENLKTAGLLKKRMARSTWPALRKAFKLLVDADNMDLANPDDIHFTYQGYAPLTVRLVETAFRPGWKGMEDVMGYLPGNTFDLAHRKTSLPSASMPVDASTTGETKRKIVLVLFIGGITISEIAALRFLNERSADRDFVVVTTHVTNGTDMIEGLIDSLENHLESTGFTSANQ